MESAAQIFHLDELWQRVLLGGLELAHILTQFRLDKVEPERAVEVGLLADFRHGLRLHLRFIERPESVFVQRPAACEGALPHHDVVLFRSGEIVHREGKLRVLYHAQVRLDAAVPAHGGFRLAVRDHALDEFVPDKILAHDLRLARGDEEVEVAARLAPAPEAPARRDADHFGVRAQVVEHPLRIRRDLAHSESPRVLLPILDAFQNVCRSLFAKALQPGHAAVAAAFLQFLHRRNLQLLPHRVDFLLPHAADVKHLEKPRREFGLEVRVVVERARRHERRDLLCDGAAYAFDVAERPGLGSLPEISRESFDRASGIAIRANLERILALQLEHHRDFFERVGDLVFGNFRHMPGR